MKIKHPSFSMSCYESAEAMYKAKAEYFEKLAQDFEGSIGHPLNDVYVVVTERDHCNPMKSRGAICMETYTGKANLVDAVKRAKSMQAHYGNAVICKLEPVGNAEACEKIINSEL